MIITLRDSMDFFVKQDCIIEKGSNDLDRASIVRFLKNIECASLTDDGTGLQVFATKIK